jgi:hypothetical protein
MCVLEAAVTVAVFFAFWHIFVMFSKVVIGSF